MGKKEKKGQKGDAIKYIARNQAIKKLQISLSQFRRLCILKGVYPVEPKNKKKVGKGSTAPRTYYYRKDIQYLLHEPVLQVLRQEQIHDRKLTKAISKKQYNLAKELNESRPFYTLDHIIKERYPTFIDALRDLDDALSMIFLFSTLPVDEKIQLEHVRECQRLSSEFMHYVMTTRCLKNVFLSIKGIYYQVEIKGQLITWITPYQFSQDVPSDVDFRVMSTFLELYETLLGFVNYKLYSELNLIYPPRLDASKDEQAAGVDAFILETRDTKQVVDTIARSSTNQDSEKKSKSTKKISKARLESVQSTLSQLAEQEDEEEEAMEMDENEADEGDEDAVPEPVVEPTTAQEIIPSLKSNMNAEQDKQMKSKLFEGCIFWISREVPRASLEFVIKSLGGQVGWDSVAGAGSPFKEDDPRITHHIMDRPVPSDEKARSVLLKYQYREYLQPQWVYDCINAGKLVKTSGYHPGEALPPHLSPFVVVKDGDYVPEEAMVGETETYKPRRLGEADEEDDEEGSDDDDFEEDDGEEMAEEDEAMEEAQPPKKKQKSKVKPSVENEDDEAKKLAVMMMSKRDKKLYDKIQFGKKRKEAAADKLRAKKAALGR